MEAAPVADGVAERPEIAPRPFTAEQLRAGLPEGSLIRMRTYVIGVPPVEELWTFVRCDETTATIAARVYGADGALLTDEGERTSTWVELSEHATFPAAATVRSEDTVHGPLGPLDVWRYTVTEPGEDGVTEVKQFEFAKTLPGPPVLMTIEREGVQVFRMHMLERSPR